MKSKYIFKYFFIASLIPLFYTFLSGLIITILDNTLQQSEFFPDSYEFEFIYFTFLSFFKSLSVFPLLITADERYANKRILCFLFWFLIPGTIHFISVYNNINLYPHVMGLKPFIHFLSITIVHLSMLILSFVLFRKRFIKEMVLAK